MKKLISFLLVLQLCLLGFPAVAMAEECPITDDELVELYKHTGDLIKVAKEKPLIKILDKPIIIIDEEDRVFTYNKLKLNLSLPSDEYPDTFIYNMDIDIDMNYDVKRTPKKKSWWDANKFIVGVVVGGITVSIAVAALSTVL